jgi:Tfp pilus assembly protein PilN
VPDVPADQAVRLAAAELRLDPESESEPLALSQLLPVPRSAPADCDSTRAALAYAAALAGACPRLGLAANLLPPEHRSASSRAMFIPTVALASALLLLVVGLGAQGMLKNRRYLAKLEAEVARLEPQVRRIQQLERESENARGRIRLLDEFRRRTKSDLDALTELTKLVKAPAWLNGLDLSRGSLAISGEADQAAPLLKTLDSSPFFKNSEFTIPLSRTSKSELFRIHASREGGTE